MHHHLLGSPLRSVRPDRLPRARSRRLPPPGRAFFLTSSMDRSLPRLRAYDISLSRIRSAVQRSNNDIGECVLEIYEAEFMPWWRC